MVGLVQARAARYKLVAFVDVDEWPPAAGGEMPAALAALLAGSQAFGSFFFHPSWCGGALGLGLGLVSPSPNPSPSPSPSPNPNPNPSPSPSPNPNPNPNPNPDPNPNTNPNPSPKPNPNPNPDQVRRRVPREYRRLRREAAQRPV